MSDFGRALHVLALETAASICLTLLLLAMTACGGGGSTSEPAVVPQARGPLVVGYYGSDIAQLEATYRHVNVHWAMGWFEDRAITLAAAKQRNLRAVLYLPEAYQGEQAVRDLFTLYRALGVLEHVAYLYPADEPDLTHGAPEIMAANLAARKVAAEFGIAPRIAVIYAGSDNFPGIESADVVGLDDYGKGAGVLGVDYDRLRATVQAANRIDQGRRTLMLVPGGADPWRQDPAPWFAYAKSHADVEMVTSFIWPDFADKGVGLGIGSNGRAEAYCREAIAFTGGTC